MNRFIILSVLITLLVSCGQPDKRVVVNNTADTATPVAARKLPSPPPLDMEKAIGWLGKWRRSAGNADGELTVSKLKPDGTFFFILDASDTSGRTAELFGTAHILGDSAVYLAGDSRHCAVVFRLSGDTAIRTNDHNSCSAIASPGISFSGSFSNAKLIPALTLDTLPKKVYLNGVLKNETEDKLFRKVVGNSYQTFENTTEVSNPGKDADGFNARVTTSMVKTLPGIMENIVMMDTHNHVWAAVINEDSHVLYFTNDKTHLDKLPVTIENWRQAFARYPVDYKSVK